MDQRTGIMMMVAGGVIALGGLIWLATGNFDGDSSSASTEPTAAAASTSSAETESTLAEGGETTTTVAATTTSEPSSTESNSNLAEGEATTSTSAAPTTTTTTTTTTVAAVESIEEFLVLFRQALDTDDIDFLFARLHPIVVDSFGEELCLAFVEREIAILEDYEATAAASAPQTQTIQGVQVDVINVPVSFGFQGESFEATSSYALVDGEVRYFTECR